MVRICDSEQREPRNSPWLFSFSWEQRKVNEIADIVGGGTPSTHNPSYWDGDINWYAPAEMEGKRYAVNSERKITQAGLSNSSAKILPAGRTILFTSRAGIGKVAILQHDAATNQGFQSLVLKDGISPYFIYSMGSILKKKAEGIASGSTFLEISGKMLGNIDITIPSSSEQHIIADFFRNLDDLITLHQCKYFYSSPKSGIFHNEKTNAWEQRQFEKTFSLLQNNTLSRAELSASAGVAANIHYGDVLIKFGEYLDMRKETFPWIEKQTDADKFRTSFLQDGDVVFADTAEDETAGKCCEIGNCGSMVIISGLHTIPCRPESKFASGYLGYYLNSTAFHEQLVPLMQGTKVVSISKAALKSTFVRYPSDDKEQQKIGTFFRKLDDLLALHQRE